MSLTLKAGVAPPPFADYRVKLATYVLVAVNRALGVSATVTDWYRDATANLAVGGAPDSQHLSGTAFDLRNDAGGAAMADVWRQLGLRVIDERATKNHWHLDLGV